MKMLNKTWFAIIIPALVGFGFAALCILFFKSYGYSLFVGLPVLVSFLSAFCTALGRKVPFSKAYKASVNSLLFMGLCVIIFALDGLACLLMAMPPAMFLALIGTWLGWIAARVWTNGIASAFPMLLILLFPSLVAFEAKQGQAPPIRSVTTSVLVSASVERVWDVVVAFPRISDPQQGIFRMGIAYPMEARIEGKGVGAIRYCTFSTGSFVEPITHWDPPSLLAFDVISCPEPMKELSIYHDIKTPHLHGFMVSRNGQFHLYQNDGKVILEGTTWYTHSLYPQLYWGPISDIIIHQIHERVLNHIKQVAEAGK